MLQKLKAVFKLVSSPYLLLDETLSKVLDICHSLEARLGVPTSGLYTLRFGRLTSNPLAFLLTLWLIIASAAVWRHGRKVGKVGNYLGSSLVANRCVLCAPVRDGSKIYKVYTPRKSTSLAKGNGKVRFITKARLFKYAEEKDPSLWRQHLDRKQTKNMALYGHPEDESPEEKQERRSAPVNDTQSHANGIGNGATLSEESSQTRAGDGEYQISSTITGQKIDPEKGRDIAMVTWFGDNDPEMPLNWPLFKKVFVTFEICLLTFSVYVGSAIYSAGIGTVVKDFGVSQTKATLGLTLFVAGYGLGPMIWAPMSEIPQIGRNPIYIGTLAVFVILQVPTALPANFAVLLCFRFLTGFIGSPALAIGGASIGDMFAPKKRAYGIVLWGIAIVFGPVLGPLVGGFAAQAEGWSWTIWALMWLCGVSLVLCIFFLPETSSSNILYRRTRRLRKLTGIESLRCQPEIVAEHMTGKEIALIALVRPITLNFTEPMVFLLNLYIALMYGLVYIWFESFPIVFEGIYKFNLGEEGLAFVGILLGAVVVIPPFFYYLYKVVEPQFNENGELTPEKRLLPAFVGGFCIPVCLFWFGRSARPGIHWIMPIVGSGFFSVGTFLLYNSVLNYLPDAYPEYAASLLAGNGFTRSSFGASFPLFATAMYKNLGVGWASSTLGFLSIAFIPIPFVLYRYGERIRKRSKLARQDF